VAEIEESAQKQEGEQRPTLPLGPLLAQEDAPGDEHREQRERYLKGRNSKRQQGPRKIRPDQSERQQGGTKAADHGGFHYTFRETSCRAMG